MLTATVLPDNATNKAVKWTSSDDKVVSVTASGEINCLKRGEAKITATNEASGKSDTVTVKVTNVVVAHN